MRIFKSYISTKIILKVLLSTAILGMIFILFTINKMNTLLNSDLGFDKDSVYTIKTHESHVVLPDSLIFSSALPGFYVKNQIGITSEYTRDEITCAHQYISNNYFDLFNYKKLIEKASLLKDIDMRLVYINQTAAKKLGIYHLEDAPGTRLLDENNNELLVCGVVEDFKRLAVNGKQQAIIFQMSPEHLAYAFYCRNGQKLNNENLKSASLAISFQDRIQLQNKLWEDIVYSAFLFTNALILLICLGFIGSKYASKKEKELFKIFGIGVHILTLIISKTYIYLLVIMGLVAGPVAYLIQKFWLGIYTYKVHFGLVDLFIILSMALLTVYLICCPKSTLENKLKGKIIMHNSI